MSSLADFQNTVKREREILKLIKKREQEKRKSLRKAARTLKKKVSAAKKTVRALEREKARKARDVQRETVRKTRKMARGNKASKVTLNISPGKTLKDYVKKSPHFKRPLPTARQRALELTVGQGMDITPEMLKEIEEAHRLQQRVKTDDEELEELERMVEADEAAEEYLDFMAQQPSPTLSDIEEDMMGGKRRRKMNKKKRKTRKSKKVKKGHKNSKKSRRYKRRR